MHTIGHQAHPLPVHDPQPAPKRVRISLPPSPPPEVPMQQQPSTDSDRHPRRPQRTGTSHEDARVVLPADQVEGLEHQRLRSGSKWRQADLALLKVKFEPDEDFDPHMLDVEHEWSPSQRQRIFLLLVVNVFLIVV